MTCHYPDLGSASDWLKREDISFQPIRSTTKIWAETRYQYGISALVTQTSFCEGSSGDLVKRRLFSQATLMVAVIRRKALRSFIPCLFIILGARSENPKSLRASLLAPELKKMTARPRSKSEKTSIFYLPYLLD